METILHFVFKYLINKFWGVIVIILTHLSDNKNISMNF